MNKTARSDPLSELGMKLGPSDRTVLSILIDNSNADSMLTIGEITRKASTEYELDVSLNWVYKCIEELAGLGLVVVNKLRRPAACFTTKEVIARSLEHLIDLRLAEILRRKQTIDEETALLDSVTADAMAESLISALAAPNESDRGALVLGAGSVASTINGVIMRTAEHGSTIRFMQSADAVPESTATPGPFERGVLNAMERGVRVRALITAASEDRRNKSALLEFVDGMKDSILLPLREGGLQLRFHPSPIRSYRMMAVDTDLMLLFMSESYMPEAVTILKSPQDSVIIEDAISTFEQKWVNSIDLARFIEE